MQRGDRAPPGTGVPPPDRAARLLHLLQRSAVASNQADRVEDAIARVLADVCELLGWETGHGWLTPEDGPGGFDPTGIWHPADGERFSPLRDATPRGRIEPQPVLRPHLFAGIPLLWGVGLDEDGPPRVHLSSGRTIPVEEMAWPRMRVAWDCGLRSFFLVPIRIRDETVGVLELGSVRREVIDSELVETLGQVGTQLGRVFERARAERELRRREEHLRAVLGALIDTPVVVANREGRIVESFGALEAIRGLSTAGVLATTPSQWIGIHDLEPLLAGLEEVFETGEPRQVERRIETRKGPTWLDLRLYPLRDGSGAVDSVLCLAFDLTGRKRLEDDLRESERFASRLSEVSPVGIFRLDPSGRATYVNDRLREISGASLEEALSEGWRARLADPADPNARALDAAIAAGRAFSDLLSFRHPDGALVGALSQAVPDRDESGRLLGFVGTLTDVTELRRMDAALRESERFTSRLAEVLPVGIFRTDAEGRPVYLNERCYEISGMRPEEVGAATAIWPRTERPEERAAFVAARQRSLEQAAPLDQEVRFLRPDGSPAWALVQALPDLDEDGRFVGHVGTITEITESRLAAEELARHRDRLGELVAERTAELELTHERLRESERLAAVGTFAAGIAHQINNPVGGILLAAQYAKDRPQDRETVAIALEHIVADARRCGRIVRGVLEFARGDVGVRKPCDLNRIVRDASDQVAYDAEQRNAVGRARARGCPAAAARERIGARSGGDQPAPERARGGSASRPPAHRGRPGRLCRRGRGRRPRHRTRRSRPARRPVLHDPPRARRDRARPDARPGHRPGPRRPARVLERRRPRNDRPREPAACRRGTCMRVLLQSSRSASTAAARVPTTRLASASPTPKTSSCRSSATERGPFGVTPSRLCFR